MKRMLLILMTFVIALNLAACGGNSAPAQTEATETAPAVPAADAVYTGAVIYTEDAENTVAEAMAVRDGKIVYVGNAEGAQAYIGEGTEVTNLEGKMITPNLIDSHSHPGIVATTAWYTDMPADCDTQEEILAFVKDFCDTHSAEEYPYIYFEYYPSNLFDENGPRREWIDEVVSDRAILIEDFSDHACWVNTHFLELIGAFDEGVISEADKEFMTNSEGEYTGWIREFVWQNYIGNLYEKTGFTPSEEVNEENLTPVLDDFKSWGVTAVMDACVLDDAHVKTVSDMDKAGKLNMYYEFSYRMYDYSGLESAISEVHRLNETYGTDRVYVDTIKIFYDGTNELGDAALVDGWITDESQKGFLLMDLEQTVNTLRRCNEEGIDVHFHMVGDLAFRQVCDATEALIQEVGPLNIQVEMCHCEYINPADYDRPQQLGIIVNWTPHWTGGYFGDASLKYMGQERYDDMYKFNPLIESGAIVTFGSDIYSMYEENRGNPYFGMQTAMTRIDPEGVYGEGVMRESESSKLSLEDLLRGYTRNGAIQMRLDDRTGSLEVGKNANFNVYDENLFEVAPEEMMNVLPAAVYFEGSRIN